MTRTVIIIIVLLILALLVFSQTETAKEIGFPNPLATEEMSSDGDMDNEGDMTPEE